MRGNFDSFPSNKFYNNDNIAFLSQGDVPLDPIASSGVGLIQTVSLNEEPSAMTPALGSDFGFFDRHKSRLNIEFRTDIKEWIPATIAEYNSAILSHIPTKTDWNKDKRLLFVERTEEYYLYHGSSGIDPTTHDKWTVQSYSLKIQEYFDTFIEAWNRFTALCSSGANSDQSCNGCKNLDRGCCILGIGNHCSRMATDHYELTVER
jgi:hypothetical protein